MTQTESALAALDREIADAFSRRMALLGGGGNAMASTLFATIGELERCQLALAANGSPIDPARIQKLSALPTAARVACPGVPGAYTHMACETLFPAGDLLFFEHFEQVTQAVAAEETAFGVLPVENSSAGQVNEALESTAAHGFFICAETSIKVEHCLCAHPDTDPDTIHLALSHPQALAQCARFLLSRGLATESFSNTATAAKEIAAAATPRACVCSLGAAKLYRLRVLARDIQDFSENYTRFVCFSKEPVLLPGADTIALSLSFPNQAGALGRLLTRFAACNLDLTRIQSLPIAGKDFPVRFHLEFRGSIEDRRVAALLADLKLELAEFSYLGNYVAL